MTDVDFNRQLAENAAKRQKTSLPAFTPKLNIFKMVAELEKRIEVLEAENKDLIESNNEIVSMIKSSSFKSAVKTTKTVSKKEDDKKTTPKDKNETKPSDNEPSKNTDVKIDEKNKSSSSEGTENIKKE